MMDPLKRGLTGARQQMRIRPWAILAATAATLTAAAPALAVTPGAAVTGDTYPFAARLTVGDQRGCSGALVAPQWVITSSACFDGVPAGLTTRVELGGGVTSTVVSTVAGPDSGVTLAKLALRQTEVAPVAVATAAPAAGDTLTAAGFGRTATEWVPADLHAGEATVQAVGPATLGLTGATTCKGDAGGPVLRLTGGAPVLAGVSVASSQRGCLAETASGEGSTAARLDTLTSWISTTTAPLRGTFGATFASAGGLGGFDLGDSRDQTLAYDYDHSGKQDHVLMYRPGTGLVVIARHNPDNTYTTVFRGTDGIGGYDLRVAADRLVPFDYDGTGKLDHLLAYRPGQRIAYVLKHTADGFETVYASRTGLGGYDLALAQDQVVAFDYDHSGKQDHLLAYRPGNRIAFVLKRSGDDFATVTASAGGIGGFDLAVSADRIVPFDYDGTGKLDHLLAYRPGQKIAFVLRHPSGTSFTTVWSSFAGLPGFDLGNARDQVSSYDYDYTGKRDHLVLYRPGNRLVGIYRKGSAGAPVAVYNGTNGIGGYDLAVDTDRIVAFDADHSGGANSLLLTRPGWKVAWVVARQQP